MLGLIAATAGLMASGLGVSAQDNLAVITRHAPQLTGQARIEGSIQMLLGEGLNLDGNVSLTGDLLAPGTPVIQVKDKVTWLGVQPGTGSTVPAGYSIRLDGNLSLRFLRTRTNPVVIPDVPPPPAASGTRSVTLSQSGQSPGNWATLRDLSLSGKAGHVAVPPGAYRNFSASSSTGFILGVAGSAQPVTYSFQSLRFSGQAKLQVVGPVILHLGEGLTATGTSGVATHPDWLQIRVAAGGVTVTGQAIIHGAILAPLGEVKISGQGELNGTAQCDRFTLTGGGIVRWRNTNVGTDCCNGRSGIVFEKEIYTVVAGQPFTAKVAICPPPPSGLFSFGVSVSLAGDLSGRGLSSTVPAALNFHTVRGPGADTSAQALTVAAKGSINFFQEPQVPYKDQAIGFVQVPALPPGNYLLTVQGRNDLGATEQVFIDGNGQVLDGGLTYHPAQVVVTTAPASPFAPFTLALALEDTSLLSAPTLSPVEGAGAGILAFDFTTESGPQYFVQYSGDLLRWITVLPSIAGDGSRRRWIDLGPPETHPAPSEVAARFYRLLQLKP